MQSQYPRPAEESVYSVGTALLLSILTCGIYMLFWQYAQIQTLNAWLGRREYDFWTYLLLSILTCGLFAIYYEYKMGEGINEIQERNGMHVSQNLSLICLLFSAFGMPMISLAIQQSDINRFYGENPDV